MAATTRKRRHFQKIRVFLGQAAKQILHIPDHYVSQTHKSPHIQKYRHVIEKNTHKRQARTQKNNQSLQHPYRCTNIHTKHTLIFILLLCLYFFCFLLQLLSFLFSLLSIFFSIIHIFIPPFYLIYSEMICTKGWAPSITQTKIQHTEIHTH